jgi:hypothetical protein
MPWSVFTCVSTLALSLPAEPLAPALVVPASSDFAVEWDPDATTLLPWARDADSIWSVSLHGGATRSSEGHTSAFGLVSLTLDLESLAAGGLALPPESDTSLAEETPRAELSADTRARTPLGTPEAQLSPGLARGAVRAALGVLGADESRRRFDGMTARSRSRAALPELGLRAGTSRDESLRLTPVASDPARVTQSGARDLFVEARLTWRLDRALFSPEEVAIERLRWSEQQARERVVRRVLDTLFAWQDARLRLADPALSGAQYREAWLRALSAAAELDVLTDGWFSQRVATR